MTVVTDVAGRSGSLPRWARHHPPILLGQFFQTFLALETRVCDPMHVECDSQIFCTKELLLISKMVSARVKVLDWSVARVMVFGGIFRHCPVEHYRPYFRAGWAGGPECGTKDYFLAA